MQNDNTKSKEQCHQPISIIVGSESNVRNLSVLPPISRSNHCNNSSNDSRARFLTTLKSVGWPVIQSGLSTLLGQ